MASPNPRQYHISASAIASFKACPTRFRLAYREGLRTAEDTDSQRMGTNWHALHEVYHNAYAEEVARLNNEAGNMGTGVGDDTIPEQAHEAGFDAAVEHLNECYDSMPTSKTAEEWSLERQILLISFIGYLWYYSEDPIEPLVSELAFDLPVHAPKTGLPLRVDEVIRVGKIDHIALWQGRILNVERKSTSRSIDPDSDYWEVSRKDDQVSMYALACQDMARAGQLPKAITGHKSFDPNQFGNTLYDVWHKPTIKPAKLAQKDTAALIESGEYMGTKFDVQVADERDEPTGEVDAKGKPKTVRVATVLVDGTEAEVTPGAKGFAIRETVEMFGARLLTDIYERPEFYFRRQEIPRSDKELRRFRFDVFNVYQAMKMFEQQGVWFENSKQCRATFPCPYINVCYGPGSDAVCDGETTPDGYKRIFVDLTKDRGAITDEA